MSVTSLNNAEAIVAAAFAVLDGPRHHQQEIEVPQFLRCDASLRHGHVTFTVSPELTAAEWRQELR